MENFVLYKNRFEMLKRDGRISVCLPVKHYWTIRILNWAAKAEKNNSNIIHITCITTKEKIPAKITEIKAVIKDDVKEFTLVLELLNDK